MNLAAEECATLYDIVILIFVESKWRTYMITTLDLLFPVDITQRVCAVNVQFLLMPMKQGGEYQLICTTGMMKPLKELRVFILLTYHVFR